MQIMKCSIQRLRGRACPVVLAMACAAGLCLVLPARAQVALPPLAAPPQPAPLTLPQLPPAPSISPQTPVLPPAPGVRPPALQVLPTVPTVPGLPPVATPALPPVVSTVPPSAAMPPTPEASARIPGSVVELDGVRGLVPPEQWRATTVRELLRRFAGVLEADPQGEPVRRQELVWVSPKPLLLRSALALGFVVLRTQNLPELDLQGVVLRPPPGMATAQALVQLRALAPDVEADFNHVYTGSGDALRGAPAAAQGTSAAPRRVGLVDGGVDRQHAALRGARLHPWGCNGEAHPSPHGTAVASLLVGRETVFASSATGTTLYAADIFCGQPSDGAVEAIAQALAWMVRENVAVVNVSLVGPPNRLLERAVQAMVRKGFLLVAAVGNDGPAAPPLYPAAYAGVVGVTAVSSERKALPEAARGPHVVFAALGAGVAVAQPGGGYTLARGTSFAAPRVAGLLAQVLVVPGPQAASAALARLAAGAVDLGATGRDPVFGYGLVAIDYK